MLTQELYWLSLTLWINMSVILRNNIDKKNYEKLPNTCTHKVYTVT